MPGTFISSEITTYFPEDRCKIHCLVSGISEVQFAEIMEIRENVYDLRRYLQEHEICHSVAHALYAVNDQLALAHFEKLLLMFNCFERINGARYHRANHLLGAVCEGLTPAIMDELAERHGLEPNGPEPWRKRFTAGSDDHSGLYVASAYTATPRAATAAEFVAHLRAGRHISAGASGSSLKLAHTLYLIAYAYYKDRFLGANSDGGKNNLIGGLLQNFLRSPCEERSGGLARRFFGRVVRPWKLRRMSAAEQALVAELSSLFGDDESGRSPGIMSPSANSFTLACRISQGLTYRFLCQFMARLKNGAFIESLQTLVSLGPVFFSVAPYLTAFRSQHKDERLLDAVAERFSCAARLNQRDAGRVWLNDGVHGLRGNVEDMRELCARLALIPGAPAIVTCMPNGPEDELPHWRNFKPVGMFEFPEYRENSLAFPPLLEIVEYLESREVGELLITTPGLLGVAGLVAARLLELRTVGVYSLDVPGYVKNATEDNEVAHLAKRYILWFYSQCDVVYAPDPECRRQLLEGGVEVSSWSESPRFDLGANEWQDMLGLGLLEGDPAATRLENAVA